jgi:DNA-directed RNA polymerase specialized sigma24 family protein
MGDRDRVVGLRGDEAELFRGFNDELVRRIGSYVIHDDPEVIVDACGFAWAQLMRHQPDRDSNWQGWLFRTAAREAWRLSRESRRDRSAIVDLGSDVLAEEVSPVDEIEMRQDVVDALSVLAQLDLRLQRVALLRALGFKHPEIAELTGESEVPVDHLLVRAYEAMREILAERTRGERRSSPRAARLWELEHEPPSWLVDRIGLPRRASHKHGVETERRSWRRAALALGDYRAALRPNSLGALSSAPPADPAVGQLYERVVRASLNTRLPAVVVASDSSAATTRCVREKKFARIGISSA